MNPQFAGPPQWTPQPPVAPQWPVPVAAPVRRRRWVPAVTAVVVVLLAAVASVAAVVTGIRPVPGQAVAAPVGPDFATLTDAMQLTKSDYPSIDGAKFQSQSVSTADNDETGGSTSFCDNPLGPTKAGDQSAGTRITLANSRGVQKRVVSSSLMRTASPVDLQNWADRCLPGHQSGIDSSGFEVAGMPSGALVVEQRVAGSTLGYVGRQYIRGVLVTVVATVGNGRSAKEAQEALVTVFTHQADLLYSLRATTI